MKELQRIIPQALNEKHKMQISAERPAIKHQFVGTMRQHPGHGCFELNMKTWEVSFAEFKSVDAAIGMDGRASMVRRKLIMKPDCVYVTALNLKNAMKKFEKMISDYKP